MPDAALAAALADANALCDAGRWADAERALRGWGGGTDPAVDALMGIVLVQQGRAAEAEPLLKRAAAGNPADGSIRLNLASVQFLLGRFGEAQANYEALAQGALSGWPAVWMGLAAARRETGDFDGAIAASRRAIALAPGDPAARYNLAASLVDTGQVREGLEVYRASIAAGFNLASAIPNYLMALHYDEACRGEEIAAEHARLGPVLARVTGAPGCAPLPVRMPAGRRVRIGYLSFDLRAHVVGTFMEGLARGHDRAGFEVIAYHVGEPDRRTDVLRAAFERFEQLGPGISDAALCAKIRGDGVDVLIELGGHTTGSRAPVLARRAAPLQLSYLGYPNVTGLPGVDGRLVDGVTDPVEGSARGGPAGGERLIRLGRCFLAYSPPADAPAPGKPPRATKGHVTFGSFNATPKVNAGVLAAWARVLHAVPGSRLYIKSRGLSAASARERTLAALEGHGIAPERVTLEGWRRGGGGASYLEAYSEVDIALDTFPYCGTTTTCEALWMGVPVVSLAGRTHVSRVGASILGAAGLADLVALNEARYVEVAAALARDEARLEELRGSLRAQVGGSALCDAPGLARAVEAAVGGLLAAS